MTDFEKTVFISYRRDVSSFIARAIFMDLRYNGYDVFMDVESIDSGAFDTVIANQIAARAHFVLILTPGSLERCLEPDDWLRREIETAMDLERNIVPVTVNNFSFKEMNQYLTGKLARLSQYNSLNAPHDYFDEAMNRLRTRFLKQPIVGVIVPSPVEEQQSVDKKIQQVAKTLPPTNDELKAEEFFNLGILDQEKGNFDDAIENFSKAIMLNPNYEAAHNYRGLLRVQSGQLEDAIADRNAVTDTDKKHYFRSYIAQGNSYIQQDDLINALKMYSKAIDLAPSSVEGYRHRASAFYHKGDWDKAIDDYDRCIQLAPNRVEFFNDRGESYFAQSQYEQAIADFKKANDLNPGGSSILAGLSITYHALGNVLEGKRLWNILVAINQNYRDVEWVKEELNWAEPLAEEARKLIARLDEPT